MSTPINREQWLTNAAELICEDIIAPATSRPRPEANFQVSVGFPNGRPTKVAAQCWVAEKHAANMNQIFINPMLEKTIDILDALAHELIHYWDNCESKHGTHLFFGITARAIGLEGKLTATYAGEALKARLQDIIDILPPFPHEALDAASNPNKPQKSRMIKVDCVAPACGFSFRTTKKHLERITNESACPACDHQNSLKIEIK